MAGMLYLVATPIGNLGDFSPRAVETLARADFIAAEDTRVSVKLLNHFDIRKPLVSYHEHNRAAAKQYFRDHPEEADKLEAAVRENFHKLMGAQSRTAAKAAGRAVDVSADDFDDAD